MSLKCYLFHSDCLRCSDQLSLILKWKLTLNPNNPNIYSIGKRLKTRSDGPHSQWEARVPVSGGDGQHDYANHLSLFISCLVRILVCPKFNHSIIANSDQQIIESTLWRLSIQICSA